LEQTKAYASSVRIWTEEDANAAQVFTRLWRWRIYAMIVIVIVLLLGLLISKL
jgi:uncharacterized BrkB/YihY/UPF0761 family membrane protein